MDFFDALPFDKILNGSGWAAAFWAVLYVARMVYTGQLVPRRTHEDTVAALAIERKRNELLLEQLSKVTDSMETFEAFVRALPQPMAVTGSTRPVKRQRDRRDWSPTGEDGA